MQRHAAFLRAINVGGHFVTMPELVRVFEKLGHAGVETFLASGNVVYWLCAVKQSDSKFSNAALEKALGVRATIRGYKTLARLAVKYFGVPAGDVLA